MFQPLPLDRLLDTSSLKLEENLSITDALIQCTRSGAVSILVNCEQEWFSLSLKTLKQLVEQGKGYLKLRDILVIIPPYQSEENVNIWELLRLMRSYRVDCLTVVDELGETIGVIMLADVLKFLEKVARPHLAGGWYEYITDTSAEGIFIVDLDLNLLFVNSRLSTLLGYDIGMMEGKNLNDFLVVLEQNEQTIETEKPFRFQAKDGTDVWAIVVVTPLFDEQGYNIGTLGRISNITEKVTKQRKEKRKTNALEIATEGIAILNNRGQFIYSNPSFSRLFHKTEQELIETNWWAIYGNYRRTPVEVELKQNGKWQGEFLYNDRYLDVSLSIGEEDIICICRDVTDRYQALQVIKESEERYRLLADYSTDVIARCSPQGKYYYISPACAEVFGYKPEEMNNHIFFDYIHPEDLTRVQIAYQVMLEKLESNRFVYRFLHKEGSYIWIETTAKVKRYPETKSPLEIVTVSREITETIEAEIELTNSQEHLKLALEATNDGLWEWDIASGHINISDRWLEMIGYDRSDLVPHINTWLEILHPEDKDQVLEILNQHLNNQTDRYETEFRMRKPDGNYKWVFAKGRVVERDQQGQPLRMLGAHSDIDQRKTVEEKLKKQYQRAVMLGQITNQIRSSFDIEAVLVRTVQELSQNFKQSCLLVTNSHNQRIIYPSDDRISRLDLSLLPSSLFETDQLNILSPGIVNLDCISDLAVVRTSYQNKWNGLIVICSWQAPFHWQKGDIELLEAVAEQVGIAIAQAELLREAQVQSELAQTASQAKSNFLAMMSHEIRTPMNGVIGMADLLLRTELNDYQKELTQTILQSSNTLLAILNDILDFSKIESGQMTLDYQLFDLPGTIEDILALMTPLSLAKELELVYDYDLSLPALIRGDVTRIRQVLVNLLSNALKFCHHGQILLEVTRFGEQQLLFTIEDTGIGIDPNKIGNLFLPFSQLDPSTTRNYGGTGLGLAISKFLVELMEGDIWVESNNQIAGKPPAGWHYRRSLEQGSSFYVTLPIGAIESSPPLRPINKNILVIEPNPNLRAILQRWLSAWGMTIEMEATMATAQALLAHKTFDVILIDDALSLEEIMGCVANVNCPVVLLQRPSGEPFPFVTTLTKPIKPHTCYQLLELLLMPQSTPPQPPSPPPPFLPAMQVLLVEDNPVNQKVAQRLLQKLGFNPDLALNGVEALSLMRSRTYDVVLMDVQMPEMDGLTATQRIRTEFEHQPYIIAMTANAMRGDRESCIEAGMNDYLSKPINLESLEQALIKVKLLK